MKLAMVSEHASPLAILGGVDAGGQNVHVASLSHALAGLGHDVTVHTRRDDPQLPDQVAMHPRVRVAHVDAGPAAPVPKDDLLPYMDEFAARLSRRWRADPPQLVHAHFWMSGKAALEAARPLGIPVAITFHALGSVKRREQGAADTSPDQRISIENRLARQADAIVATCRDEVLELVTMGAPPDRVSVVPCGVDLSLFQPHGPSDPRRSGLRRIVVLGRMVPRKGIADVVEALARVPRTELVIAGGPKRSMLHGDPEARRIRGIAQRCGVADRVELRGRIARREVPHLLRSADLVVSVPWYEPFGIVPVEAMACAVPVVGSGVGGLLDTVIDGVTGVLVAPRRPDLLSGVISELLDDEPRRRRMGQAGARRAAERYEWSQVATATSVAYATLVGSASRHARISA